MDNLTERLRKAMAFDEQDVKSEFQNTMDIETLSWFEFLAGAQTEHSRRAKLDQALVELIEAIDNNIPDYNSAWSFICLMAEGEGSDWRVYQQMAKRVHAKLRPALAALEKALGEGK